MYKNKLYSINFNRHLFKSCFSLWVVSWWQRYWRVTRNSDFLFLLEFAEKKTFKTHRSWMQFCIPNVTFFCISHISKNKVYWWKAKRSKHIVFQANIFITFSYWLNQSCHHLLNYNSMGSTVTFQVIFHVDDCQSLIYDPQKFHSACCCPFQKFWN